MKKSVSIALKVTPAQLISANRNFLIKYNCRSTVQVLGTVFGAKKDGIIYDNFRSIFERASDVLHMYVPIYLPT